MHPSFYLPYMQEQPGKITDNNTFNCIVDHAYRAEQTLDHDTAIAAWQCIGKHYYPVSLLLHYHPVSRILLGTADEFRN